MLGVGDCGSCVFDKSVSDSGSEKMSALGVDR